MEIKNEQSEHMYFKMEIETWKTEFKHALK